MGQTAKPRRDNRTIPIDCPKESPYSARLGTPQAFVAFGFALLLSSGFPRLHKAPWRSGGGLPRPSPSVRVRVGGLPLWRIECATCQAVCTVLPPGVLRYRTRRPEGARDAL